MSTTIEYSHWAKGYGVIQHQASTQRWVNQILDRICDSSPDKKAAIALFSAADRIANAAMWLVVHETYAKRISMTGRPLSAADFKSNPQGHTGGALNVVPAYVGYMLANAVSGITRAWLMGQGHCVAAIDSVNLLLDNMHPTHAKNYSYTQAGLTRYINDFYGYRLNAQGYQESPLGSHVNIHTAGSCLEGGYLGFAELQYIHMPLPGECLVAFLSDGAFEEQRGSDWMSYWWRAEDTGLVIPIMIWNGRRIDQRTMLAQEIGVAGFMQHLKNYNFEPIVFDGTDPAAFACMILTGEQRLKKRSQLLLSQEITYPVMLPYGIAVTKKGAGFYGAGTNAAHNLPLVENPSIDTVARAHFNASAQRLFVPHVEVKKARMNLNNHALSHRIRECDHPIANRSVDIHFPIELPFRRLDPPKRTIGSPIAAIDTTLLAYVTANSHLRPRIGNPDELLSNHLQQALQYLKHRVTTIEPGLAEAIDGKVITTLNEEAVACACLGNKAGLNMVVSYEAFAPKMLGAFRQELIWVDHLLACQRQPGWLSLPLVLTSHTYENGKNERSHQDPMMAEALLGEPSDISRVLFPADYNSAVAALDACYKTRGKIFTLIVAKSAQIQDVFTEAETRELLEQGITCLASPGVQANPQIILSAIGSYQLQHALKARHRLAEHHIAAVINYIIEPGRLREPRSCREAIFQLADDRRAYYYPPKILSRVFISHTRPEVMAGVLRPLDTGKKTIFLGYINQGGTLDTAGMIFVNRQSWAHIVQACARSLDIESSDLLRPIELDALNGLVSPQGIII